MTEDTLKPCENEIIAQSNTPSGEDYGSNGDNQQVSIVEKEQSQDENKVGLKSEYWKYLDRFKEGNDWFAKCRHCRAKLSANSSNGTTNLQKHVKNHCKGIKRVLEKQSTIHGSFSKHESKTTSCSFDQDESRKDLAKMIIMHEYPLSIVDHIGMRKFLSRLQPIFKCPTRNTIKRDIIGIFENEKHKAMKAIEGLIGRVAITSDMWTANNQTKGYMAITAHFIDNSWKLQSRLLSFTYVPAPHTSEVLCDTMMRTLLEWNIDRKVSTITLDNCSTNDAMIDVMLGRLDTKYLMLGGRFLHMRCCAHILNLIVQEGLDVIKHAVSTIRFSVSYWSCAPKRLETFVSTCAKSRIPYKKGLVADCRTRWNSTYLMLESAIPYKDVFSRLKQRDHRYQNVPTDAEWELATIICGKLKVFYDVTKLFSATQYPTANVCFGRICEIQIALNDWILDASPLIRDMASSMITKFAKYWEVIHGMMGVAVILNPRYKMALLEFYYCRLYDNNYIEKVNRIQHILYELVDEYQHENESSLCNPRILAQENVIQSDDMVDFDVFVKSKKRLRGAMNRTELDFYLEEDVLPRSMDFDLLMWWKLNGVKYPTLQNIARDVFAIPVFTVASESAFSTGGRVINPNRNKLKEATVEALMCSQNWLWVSEKGEQVKPISVDDYITVNNEEEETDEEIPITLS